jgi:hypothetical protein
MPIAISLGSYVCATLLVIAVSIIGGCERDAKLNDGEARALVRQALESYAERSVQISKITHAVRRKGKDNGSLIKFEIPLSEVAALKDSVVRKSSAQGWQIDDDDRRYTGPSLKGTPNWWKPNDLPDVDALAVIQRGESRNRGLWLAFSARTGIVYIWIWHT